MNVCVTRGKGIGRQRGIYEKQNQTKQSNNKSKLVIDNCPSYAVGKKKNETTPIKTQHSKRGLGKVVNASMRQFEITKKNCQGILVENTNSSDGSDNRHECDTL